MMLSFQDPRFGVPIKMECIPDKKKARFDRDDPPISKRAGRKEQRAAYQAELNADLSDPGADPPPFSRPVPRPFRPESDT
jgi:hypothetical protein